MQQSLLLPEEAKCRASVGEGPVEDELKDPQKRSLTENSELGMACSAVPPVDSCEDGPAGLCCVRPELPSNQSRFPEVLFFTWFLDEKEAND